MAASLHLPGKVKEDEGEVSDGDELYIGRSQVLHLSQAAGQDGNGSSGCSRMVERWAE
jgi:hypothetical protein